MAIRKITEYPENVLAEVGKPVTEFDKELERLVDDMWDHGSTDGEIFTVIKRGVPPTMMAGYDGGIPDADIWSIVNYLRTLRGAKP